VEQKFNASLQVEFAINLSVGSCRERNRKYIFDVRPVYEFLMQIQATLVRRLVDKGFKEKPERLLGRCPAIRCA
jgi:hypothetical protein